MRSTAPSREEFAEFVRDVEPRLLQALVGRYGPVDGRMATVDALSWAWEHWSRLAGVDNKAGYLYRVGQTATRGMGTRPIPHDRRTASGFGGVPGLVCGPVAGWSFIDRPTITRVWDAGQRCPIVTESIHQDVAVINTRFLSSFLCLHRARRTASFVGG
ncbi:MAG: hypothetical protein WA964_09095 [Ilumatobacter sp.]|uniref:hypothetical protein n=1 Tax=Ilumatobacter sp. TaxID=1967498 RepID=UPI003C77991A